jgi:hypothetical protein
VTTEQYRSNSSSREEEAVEEFQLRSSMAETMERRGMEIIRVVKS